jgi:hypothetical protein
MNDRRLYPSTHQLIVLAAILSAAASAVKLTYLFAGQVQKVHFYHHDRGHEVTERASLLQLQHVCALLECLRAGAQVGRHLQLCCAGVYLHMGLLHQATAGGGNHPKGVSALGTS